MPSTVPGRHPMLTDLTVETVNKWICAREAGLIHKWKNEVAYTTYATWQTNAKMLNATRVQWKETPEAPWETPEKGYD